MSFNALNGILKAVETHSDWDRYRQFRHLIRVWQEAIEPRAVHHTRPLYIRRDVLWVATESAAWAQTLSLSRQDLLVKLNSYLEKPIVGIRFSPARWLEQPLPPAIASSQYHPSQVSIPNRKSPSFEPPTTLPGAFRAWMERVQWRSLQLTDCPRCQSPTPPGEIKRWSCCAYCIRREWGHPDLNSHDFT